MACEECCRNCQLTHGKNKDLSPSVSRFCKIFIGDDISEILCLPPIFDKTIMHLIGKDAKLENSSGGQWTVTLSNHKGFLAFHKGWTKFAADHKLQIGEILVFNYLKNGHFVVEIFEHTGREKIVFGNNFRPDKHTISTERIASEATPSQRNATNGVNFRNVGRPSKQVRPGRNLVKARTSLEMSDGDNRTSDASEKTEFDNNFRPDKHTMTTERIASEATPSQRNATNGVHLESVGHPYKQARPKNLVKARASLEMRDGDNRTTDTSDTNRKSSSTSVPIESNFEIPLSQPSTSNGPSKPKPGHEEQPCLDDATCVVTDRSTYYAPSEPKPGHEEQPCLDDASCVIMDRSSYYAETEKKVVLYDLSAFEMQKNQHISGKRCIDGFVGSMPVSKVPNTGMAQDMKAFRHMDNTGNCIKTPMGKGNFSKSPLGNGFASPLPRQVNPMDEIKAVKKEQVTLREEASDHVQKPQDLKQSLIRDGEGPSTSRFKRKATKLEPDDSLDEPALFPDSITCLAVTDDLDFIELCERLPSIALKKLKGRVDNRCSIVLIDPKGRKWPAIYRDKFGSSFTVICGWKRFNEANKICPGDQYVFSLENGSQSTYKVDVVRI